MLNSRASICIALVIFYKMALIQTTRYYFKNSTLFKIQTTQNVTEISQHILQELMIDLKSTHFVLTIELNLVSGKVTRVNYTRDLKTSDDCSESKTGFKCYDFMRVIHMKGNKFKLNEPLIHYYAVLIDKFIGCFEANESEIQKNAVKSTEKCAEHCSESIHFYGINSYGCQCISNLTSLIPVGIASCVQDCQNSPYEICGKNRSLAVHSRKTAPKNFNSRTAEKKCLFNSNCPHEKGRAGVNLELVDCSEENGMCREAECQSTVFTFVYEIENITKTINTPISTCACRSGYFTDNDLKCNDIDECQSQSACDSTATCENTQGSYMCECKKGYVNDSSTGRFICNDVDECLIKTEKCNKPSTKCVNNIGSYDCQCSDGFDIYDKKLKKCSDVDECIAFPCHDVTATNCNNAEGSFYCTCTRGYEDLRPNATLSPNTTCTDINECDKDHGCSESTTTCNNTQGSYECKCKEGYKETNKTHCEDKDECADETCDKISTSCINSLGSYKCLCMFGFVSYLDRTDQCQDIDECGSENSCDRSTTTCQNIPGSYACNCNEGLKYVTRLRCEDIDECISLQHHCGKLSTCINTIGSFDCSCPDKTRKFVYQHSIECQDVDECEETNKCNDTISFCLNMLSSYMCQCMPGYINIDNYTCASKSIEGFENTTFYIDDDYTTEEFVIDIADIVKDYIIGLIVIGSIFTLLVVACFVKCMFRCLGRAVYISSTLSGVSDLRSAA